VAVFSSCGFCLDFNLLELLGVLKILRGRISCSGILLCDDDDDDDDVVFEE